MIRRIYEKKLRAGAGRYQTFEAEITQRFRVVITLEKLDVNRVAVLGAYPYRARSLSFPLVSLDNGSVTSKTYLSLIWSISYVLSLHILARY